MNNLSDSFGGFADIHQEPEILFDQETIRCLNEKSAAPLVTAENLVEINDKLKSVKSDVDKISDQVAQINSRVDNMDALITDIKKQLDESDKKETLRFRISLFFSAVAAIAAVISLITSCLYR